jgi:preprotein translocase subunit SecD
MHPRRSWLLAAAGIVVAAGLGIGVARISGLALGPVSPTVAVLSYRLSDVPSSMTTSQARDIAIRVITRRLASHRLVNRVDPGAAADVIDIRATHATPAQVAAIVEADGVNLTIWKWVPGQVDAATLSQLGPLAAQYHPGYRPVFAGIDGTMVIHATVGQATRPPGPGVIVPFDTNGAELLDLVTRDRATQTYDTIDNRLAVFVDTRLFEDADVSGEITKGAMLLVPDVGTFSPLDAEQLADGLNAGTLPGKLTRLSSSSTATSAP